MRHEKVALNRSGEISALADGGHDSLFVQSGQTDAEG